MYIPASAMCECYHSLRAVQHPIPNGLEGASVQVSASTKGKIPYAAVPSLFKSLAFAEKKSGGPALQG